MLLVLFAYLEPMQLLLLIRFSKGKKLETVASHTINYGHIIENDEIIDEVMVSVMRAPKTFTREDVVGDQHTRWCRCNQ